MDWGHQGDTVVRPSQGTSAKWDVGQNAEDSGVHPGSPGPGDSLTLPWGPLLSPPAKASSSSLQPNCFRNISPAVSPTSVQLSSLSAKLTVLHLSPAASLTSVQLSPPSAQLTQPFPHISPAVPFNSTTVPSDQSSSSSNQSTTLPVSDTTLSYYSFHWCR